MAFETTPLWLAAKEVMDDTKPNIFFTWSCRIFAGKDIIIPQKLLNIETLQDYNKNYCDEISADIVIGYGDFITKIIPFEANLIIEIVRTPIHGKGEAVDPNFNLEALKYRAILKDKKYAQMKGSTPHNLSVEKANLSRLETVSFQLVDLTIESLRMRAVGGTFNNVSCKDVLETLLTKETKKDQSSTTYLFRGVDFVKPNNEDLRTHVIIPDGTKLLDLPLYLQARQGGLYSAGMGYYYNKGFWFLYPEFDTTRFNTVRETLTILIIPPNKMPNIENTWKMYGKSITVLVTGEVQHEDTVDKKVMNMGNGARYADANNILTTKDVWDNGKVTINRSDNNSEFVANPRPTDVNFTPITQNRITSNNMVELSNIARRLISEMTLEWQNAVTGVLYPGMPVKALFEHNNAVKTAYGVLGGCHFWTSGTSDTLVIKRHSTNCALNIYLDKNDLD